MLPSGNFAVSLCATTKKLSICISMRSRRPADVAPKRAQAGAANSMGFERDFEQVEAEQLPL
jgi:hypothetical protein